MVSRVTDVSAAANITVIGSLTEIGVSLSNYL